jgi:hypothetical protein
MGRILLVMILLGGALVYVGVQEKRLAAASKPEPQNVTCAELIKNGPGDNAHVVMSDYLILDSLCYETGRSGKAWTTVWVPAVPFGGEYHKQIIDAAKAGNLNAQIPTPRDFRVLIKSGKIRDAEALDALTGQDTIQGVVVNKISSLGRKERKILADSYPSANLDNVLILEHGRTPASAGKSYGMMGGGGALALLGVFGMVKRKSSNR